MENDDFILPPSDLPSWVEYPRSFCRIVEQLLIHITPWQILEGERALVQFRGLPFRKLGTQRNLSGFTLLELLVAIAVIAIVVILARVSYQDAHLKSQVAQSREHQRLVALAIEAYRTDQGHYPHMGEALVRWVPAITTPVAYLNSSGAARDPFLKRNAYHNGVEEFYHYENMLDDPFMDYLAPLYPRDAMKQAYGAWVLEGFSPGLDETHIYVPPGPEKFAAGYDASNGTKSYGIIRRSQKSNN